MGLRMNIFPVLVVGLALSLAACGRDPGPKGDPGPQGPAGPQGAQGVQGDAETGNLRAVQARAATVSVRAVQADGSVSCEANETLVSVFCPSGGAPVPVRLCIEKFR